MISLGKEILTVARGVQSTVANSKFAEVFFLSFELQERLLKLIAIPNVLARESNFQPYVHLPLFSGIIIKSPHIHNVVMPVFDSTTRKVRKTVAQNHSHEFFWFLAYGAHSRRSITSQLSGSMSKRAHWRGATTFWLWNQNFASKTPSRNAKEFSRRQLTAVGIDTFIRWWKFSRIVGPWWSLPS